MRICFVNDCFLKDPEATITGPMVQTYLLASGLAQRGWTVDYVATTHGDKADTTETHDGIRVHFAGTTRRLAEVTQARAARKALRSIEADVFYQRGRSMLTGVAADAARRSRAKFIWASSGEGGCRRNKYLGERWPNKTGLKRLVYRPIYARADRIYERGIESADAVLVQTERQRREMKKEFGRDSVILKSGHPIPPESVLQKSDPPVVLWIGTTKPAKQPQLFLDLIGQCGGLDARFLWVGRSTDAGWQKRLADAAQADPRLSIRGEVPFEQMTGVFAAASLLVNTTVPDYEGLPNAFVQAWLHGVPVVSLHADPDDVLAREGIGFRAGSLEPLVARTRHLITRSDERAAMGRKAREFAVREFGLETILSQLESVIGHS